MKKKKLILVMLLGSLGLHSTCWPQVFQEKPLPPRPRAIPPKKNKKIPQYWYFTNLRTSLFGQRFGKKIRMCIVLHSQELGSHSQTSHSAAFICPFSVAKCTRTASSGPYFSEDENATSKITNFDENLYIKKSSGLLNVLYENEKHFTNAPKPGKETEFHSKYDYTHVGSYTGKMKMRPKDKSIFYFKLNKSKDTAWCKKVFTIGK